MDGVNRLTARHADALIAVSEGVKKYLVDKQGIEEEKIQVIYNGVDLKQFGGEDVTAEYLRKTCNLPGESIVIGTVAAFKHQKGLQYLISAAAQVVKEYPETRFVLVGSGHMEETIRDWIKQNRLEQAFILTGQRKDVSKLLKGMDLFVLPSLWEGMPMALLEAMSMSCSCVVTDIGGPRELIEHGRSGLIVPPRDSDALAQAIFCLLKDPGLRIALGQAARRRVEAVFSMEAVARAYDGLYRKLLRLRQPDKI